MRKLTKILFPLTLSSTMLTPLVAAQCGTQAPSEENMVSLAKNLDAFMKDEKQNSKTFDVDLFVKFLAPLSSNKVEGIYVTNGMQSIPYIVSYLPQILQINNSVTDADIANLNKLYSDFLNMPANFLKISIENSETPLKYLANAGEARGFNFIQNLDEYKNAEIKDLGTISVNLNKISMRDIKQAIKILQDFSTQIQDFNSKPQDKPVLLKLSYNIKARITLNKKLDFATYANNIFDKNSEVISKMFINSVKNNPLVTQGLDEEQIKAIADRSAAEIKRNILELDHDLPAQYTPLNEQDFDNIKKLGKVLDSSNTSLSIQLR
ncbi:hypothetical protein ACNQ17_02710 [Mycoplasma sp. Sp48II]|uniref:hypothetical protein n=1 Tax=Mycoplasma sp. Sp48II TaxID=3401682 RepID=UPI003AAFEA76